MEVRKIMTKNPACCTSDSTLEEVAHMMEMYDCGCIPVVNNHQEKHPIGTITDRDIAIRAVGANKNPLDMKASDIMTTDVATVTPETIVQDCLKVMEEKQIRRILVVDKNGKINGIVAQADLAEHVTDSAKTANFVREVSESESDRSQEKGFESNYQQEGTFESNRFEHRKGKKNRKNRYFSNYQSDSTNRKTIVEKESFFTGTNLLALLGSIGVGAGLGYYLKSDAVNRPKNNYSIKPGKLNTEAIAPKRAADSLTNTDSGSTSASSFSPKSTQNKVTGTVDTFNRLDEDTELRPTTEIGRTVGNT